MADEVRLVAMRFIPDRTGGRWEPVGNGVARFKWADAWDAGITEEEASRIRELAQGQAEEYPPAFLSRDGRTDDRVAAKIDAAFPEPVPNQ